MDWMNLWCNEKKTAKLNETRINWTLVDAYLPSKILEEGAHSGLTGCFTTAWTCMCVCVYWRKRMEKYHRKWMSDAPENGKWIRSLNQNQTRIAQLPTDDDSFRFFSLERVLNGKIPSNLTMCQTHSRHYDIVLQYHHNCLHHTIVNGNILLDTTNTFASHKHLSRIFSTRL